jgi:cysteine desulfurase/selenocysteine lyase
LPVAPQSATIAIPTETELQELADDFAGSAAPQVSETFRAPSTPQIPGAPLPRETADFSIGYSFLNDIRALAPAGTGLDDYLVEPSHALPGLNLSSTGFDVQAIRRDFPILQERVQGKPLIWLDNAATTQKPQSVIDRLSYFYAHENSNIHRAAHELAARATDAYESAREKVGRFINAPSVSEIIFVRGATEGINLVAQSWGRQHIQKDDEIIVTWLEHHANIVPWQMLCAEKGAKLRVVPVDNTGQVLLDEYQRLLGQKTRLVAFAQVSNALGTVTPANDMIEMAHRYGAKVLLDGAQAVSHMPTDVQALDCDFYVFSGHKMFAPTGIGVVYGKSDVLESSPPWQGGGNMIQDVTFEKTTYQPPPGRFEAGTGNIADAVGLGAAIDYLDRIGMVNVSRYEHDLLLYATEQLQRIPGLRLIGTAKEKAGVLSFVLDEYRTEDVGVALNRQGIAVRAGHHCAQPILRRFGVESTVRPSLAFYNTCEEIDALVAALWNLKLGHHSI